MLLRVGLKTGDLIGLDHYKLVVSGDGLFVNAKQAASPLVLRARDGVVQMIHGGTCHALAAQVEVRTSQAGGTLALSSMAGDGVTAKPEYVYNGALDIAAHGNRLQAVLVTDLEHYVQGVLQSEVPSNFNLEAMRAQAVLARTYGLHPRLAHEQDGFNVCDSYLHCQAFYGVRPLSPDQRQAIADTRDQILTYQGKPALALFSACAGGHTESYQFCFSDPITGTFPPPAIPYLEGVSEGSLPAGYPSEQAMRKLFALPHPATADAWAASSFRWRLQFSANQLEGHMHHVVSELRKDAQFAAFIHPPASEQFGHIKGFEPIRRGVAGTIVELVVATTTGDWRIEKELTIRSIFANPELNLHRLKSARLFFDHQYDALKLLQTLTVSGFGNGHGVGLQQIGAQGLARQGLTYRRIIEHYYRGAEISTVH